MRRRRSTRRWPRIWRRWSPSGNTNGADRRTRRRCRAPLMRSCGWSSPAGTPKRHGARTGRAPRWWCISTSPSAPRRCIWVHCYLRPTGNI
ncbi:hypothetical protein I553_4173 [Mycobacterium xenopi 4042]|uniref:Uncharacterized protein n=1 Tax=Mycobacterium xenopi 4042 TaxID=1299334 RepID=X8AEF8_MYCXE|nr:hypothetical protein I553_4173 [Mycobacterium xenopi 4042]